MDKLENIQTNQTYDEIEDLLDETSLNVDVRDLQPGTLEKILWCKCKAILFKDKNKWRKDANGVLINWDTKNYKISHIIPMNEVDSYKELRKHHNVFEFRLFNYQLDSLDTIEKFDGRIQLFHGSLYDNNWWIETKRMRNHHGWNHYKITEYIRDYLRALEERTIIFD